jgi:hypothetical protein
MDAKTSANIPKTVKSLISVDISIWYRMSCLEASVAYDIGLTFATACNQLGMMDIGNSALLAKRSGRFNRFITAICVSHLVERMAIAINIEDNPMQIKNITAKTPKRLKTLKSGPGVKPKRKAKPSTMAACIMDLITALNTFDISIEPRATGVLRTLFKKPKRLSQTIDMPLNMHVNSTMKDTIPTDIKEK